MKILEKIQKCIRIKLNNLFRWIRKKNYWNWGDNVTIPVFHILLPRIISFTYRYGINDIILLTLVLCSEDLLTVLYPIYVFKSHYLSVLINHSRNYLIPNISSFDVLHLSLKTSISMAVSIEHATIFRKTYFMFLFFKLFFVIISCCCHFAFLYHFLFPIVFLIEH